MFLERGLEFTHEAVRVWEARFAPLIADCLRAKRRGQAGSSWYVDECVLRPELRASGPTGWPALAPTPST
jgi:putative transposase